MDAEDPETRNRGGKVARRILVAFGIIVAAVWIVAAHGIGMGLVVPGLLSRVAPDGWDVRVLSVDGDWRSRIELTDVTLEGAHVAASIERLTVRYRLLPLLRRSLIVRDIHAVGPSLVVDRTKRPEGTSPAERADTSTSMVDFLTGSPLGEWRVAIAEARISGGSSEIRMTDGTYQAQNLRLATGGALGPEGLDITLDELVTDVRVPARADSVEQGAPTDRGRLTAVGAFHDGVLDVTRFGFASPRSDVRADGRLLLAEADRETSDMVDSLDFRLRANPLDLRDLPVALPEPLRDRPVVLANISLTGPLDSMLVEGRVEATDLAVAEIYAIARPPTPSEKPSVGDRRPAIDATVDVLSVDLACWMPPPFDGILSGRLSAIVDRWAEDARIDAQATLVHDPPSDAAEGLLGRTLRAEAVVSVAAGAGVPSTAAGEAADSVAGGSLKVDSVEASVRLSTDDRLDLGEIAVAGTPEGGRWSVDLRLDSGTLEGEGRASRTGRTMAVAVDRLEMGQLDARALDPDLPATSVSGTLSGEVEGEGVETARGDVTVELGPSRVAETALDTLSFVATLDSGSARGRLAARDSSYRVDFDYHVSRSDSTIDATSEDIRVISVVDLSDEIDPSDQTDPSDEIDPPDEEVADVSVDLRGRAEGRWVLGEDVLRGWLEVRLDSSHVGAIPLHDFELDASLDAIGASLGYMVGALEATAVRAHGKGPADSMWATARTIEPGRYALDARLHPAGGGEIVVDGDGSVGQDGEAASFRVVANGSLPSPSELLGGTALGSITLEASAFRDAEEWTSGDARLLLTGTAWRELAADSVWLEARLDSRQVLVDTVHVASNLLALAGSGALPIEAPGSGSIDITGTLRDLEPIRTMVDEDVFAAERADFRMSATGSLDSTRVESTLEVRAMAVGRTRLDGLDAFLTMTVDPRRDPGGAVLTDGALDVTLDRIALPDADVESVALRVAGDRDSLRVEASAVADERRRGELLVVVDPRLEYRIARLDYMDLELYDDEWHMVEPAELSYRDGYDVSSFVLQSDDSRVAIEGGVDGGGGLDLDMQIDSVGIGTVSDLIGLPGLEGWLGGTIRLRGSTSAPAGTIAMRGAFQRGDGRSGPARIDITADGRHAVTEVELLDPDGGSLRVMGSVPLTGAEASREPPADAPEAASVSPGALDLTVHARDFGIVWALPFLDPQVVTELGGRLDGEMTVRGEPDEPEVGGTIALAQGSTRIRPLGVRFHDISLSARGADTLVVIDSARVAGQTGRMTASGSISPTGNRTLDVAMAFDEFRPIANDAYRATISGEVHAMGTVLAPELVGGLRVESADIFLDAQDDDAGLEDVELTEEDLQMLRDRFAYVAERETPRTPIHELLTADLEVEFGRDSWIRKQGNPEMTIAFAGDLEVRMRPGQDPEVFGELETLEGRGYISQFGRRFELESGTVTFSGPPADASIDVTAAYPIPSRDNPEEEATILLDVSGTQDSLNLDLSSEPAMENADIVSYIATGRPAASTLSMDGTGSEGGIATAGANLAINQLVGAVEESAARGIGLDVVEIRREGFRGATLVAGSYVSPRLYVGFAQPVTLTEGDGLSLGDGNESEVEIELEALEWLLVNIEGSGSALSFFLRGRHAY